MVVSAVVLRRVPLYAIGVGSLDIYSEIVLNMEQSQVVLLVLDVVNPAINLDSVQGKTFEYVIFANSLVMSPRTAKEPPPPEIHSLSLFNE